jgi:hypothetical protein
MSKRESLYIITTDVARVSCGRGVKMKNKNLLILLMICLYLTSCAVERISGDGDELSAYKPNENTKQIETDIPEESVADVVLAGKKGRRSTMGLSEALAWSNVVVELKILRPYIMGTIGKTIEEIGETYYDVYYTWFPGDIEALSDRSGDSVYLFSAPLFGEKSRCVAAHFDHLANIQVAGGIFSLGEALSIDDIFSLNEVINSGGDVSWVSGAETYLSYKFDGLELRIFTNKDGNALIQGQSFFIKDMVASDEMYGMAELERMSAFVRPSLRNEEKWDKFNRYLALVGKAESEIIETLGNSFSRIDTGIDESHTVVDTNGTRYHIKKDGMCHFISSLRVKDCFENIDESLEDLEMMKWFGVPFAFPITDPYRMISFDDAVIIFHQDKNGSFANGRIEIQGKDYTYNYTPGNLF